MPYETIELSALDAKVNNKDSDESIVLEDETGWIDVPLLFQSATPLCLSLLGLLLTSAILDRAQHWPVFVNVSELLLMVPVLLNLKGNLEMSVTGRLCVSCHLHSKQWWRSVSGNGRILTAQSAVCSSIVGGLSVLIGALLIHSRAPSGLFYKSEAVLVMASPMAACMASAILNYTILVIVIWWSRKRGLDPDNVATPIAAALGDLTAVGCLAVFAAVLNGRWWLSVVVIVVTVGLLLNAIVSMSDDEYELMLAGWLPIICGLLITMMAGMILERFHVLLPNLPIMLPIVNGLSGGLLSIYACRLATLLSLRADRDSLPFKTPLTLILLTIPLNLFVFVCIRRFKMGHQLYTPINIILYNLSQMLQLVIMIYLATRMVRVCRQRQWDSLTISLPLVTAISDLIGTVLLIIVGFCSR